jgi:hypothetical protein
MFESSFPLRTIKVFPDPDVGFSLIASSLRLRGSLIAVSLPNLMPKTNSGERREIVVYFRGN